MKQTLIKKTWERIKVYMYIFHPVGWGGDGGGGGVCVMMETYFSFF